MQEWLVDPDFVVYVGAPKGTEWMADLEARLTGNRTHYSPCLGPAWMLARLEWEASGEGLPLEEGIHDVATVCPRSDTNALAFDKLKDRKGHAVQEVRMPREVTADRVFTHANHYLEMNGRPMPVRTTTAWSFRGELAGNATEEVIVFL